MPKDADIGLCNEKCIRKKYSLHIDGLVQYGSNSIALAMELLQCCTKPLIWNLDECYVWMQIMFCLYGMIYGTRPVSYR